MEELKQEKKLEEHKTTRNIETQEVKGEQKLSLEDLKVGYIVGLTPNGDFVFELFGKEPGLVELLGIHQHAMHRVNRIYDEKQFSGDRLIHEVGKAISALNLKLDQLMSHVLPKNPDNKL